MISTKTRMALLSIERYSQLKQLLSNTRIPYAIIKGEPLSLLCYKEKSVRLSHDIDILVDRQNVMQFEHLLQSHEFKIHTKESLSRKIRILCVSQSHQLPPYVKETQNQLISIDLNFDLFWGEYTGKRIDINNFSTDTIEVDVYGCKVKTLSPLKAMIQIILHHYKEMNSLYHLSCDNCINLKMFKDVYYLWKNNREDISLEKLYSLCSFYEIIPYAFYVLYYTNYIFRDVDLQKYVDLLRTIEGEELLDYYGLSTNERKLWRVDFMTRLKTENIYNLIKDDLTEFDLNKIKQNKEIFG